MKYSKSAAFLATLMSFCFSPVIAADSTYVVAPSFFKVPEDLEITLWATSPAFFNPTNIDIDAKGRIWVAEGVNYRSHFDRRPEGDRIMVLEDTDGDGKADKSWPFVQEKFLRAPMGVAVIGNKVVVSMTPDLIVYTDHDGDAVFDAAKGDTREVLLTGFNGRNHDHSLHSVTVGPDGKWYLSAGNCGGVVTDKSGKTFRIGAGSQNMAYWPKDPQLPDIDTATYSGQKSDDGYVWVGGFIARINPDGTHFEVMAHNLRNSYENCVTSWGDIFANDNDDQPACRTFAVLPGGNYGFASSDGWRAWQIDRRPGQDLKVATWRQNDPGSAPAGDVYGGGSPTGIVFYENGALGEKWENTLLSCEAARNCVFGYKPVKQGAGWKLERFDFITTNQDGKIVGTDFTGGDGSASKSDTKTLFRPSDIAVGPDGALYIADWYDPRVGGHNDLDDTLSGSIYRVAPKGFKSVVPAVDVSTSDGALAALKSPAVHVRALGAEVLRKKDPAVIEAFIMAEKNPLFQQRLKALKAEPVKSHRQPRSVDESVTAAKSLDHTDRAALEAWGLGTEGKETEIYEKLLEAETEKDPTRWSEKWATIAWRLHPVAAIGAFKSRALHDGLSAASRLAAITAIGLNNHADAATAMLEIAQKTSAPIKDEAMWWLMSRKDSLWKDYAVNEGLKQSGLYDPDTFQITPVSLPAPPPSPYTVADVLKLTGDAKRGEAVSQRCYMCHKFGEIGQEFGPNMTTWGQTQTREVIALSLVEPSADLAHGFYGVEIVLTDDRVIHGLVVSDGDPVIVTSMGGITQPIPKAKIKSKNNLGRSLMMSAAQLGLTAQEVADVIAFMKK